MTRPTSSDAAAPKSESTTEVVSTKQQDAVASEEKTNTREHCEPVREQPKAWVDRVLVLVIVFCGPQSTTLSMGSTLLTGVKLGEEDRLVDDLMDWERKLENANFRQSRAVPSERSTDCVKSPHGRAWENGFVPEGTRITF